MAILIFPILRFLVKKIVKLVNLHLQTVQVVKLCFYCKINVFLSVHLNLLDYKSNVSHVNLHVKHVNN